VDNDVRPALAAGMAAVHLRRGPWGMLQPTPRKRPRSSRSRSWPPCSTSVVARGGRAHRRCRVAGR
jgi:hypothetical protein